MQHNYFRVSSFEHFNKKIQGLEIRIHEVGAKDNAPDILKFRFCRNNEHGAISLFYDLSSVASDESFHNAAGSVSAHHNQITLVCLNCSNNFINDKPHCCCCLHFHQHIR